MQILKRKNEYDIIDNVEIVNDIPVGNFELSFGAFGRIYLNQIQDIIIPEKVYSNDTQFIEHVLHSWKEGQGNVGVALAGGKGLGKSFTGNMLAKGSGVPVIRVTGTLQANSGVFSMLNSIECDYVLFIDEFEKLFNTGKNNGDQMTGTMTQQDFLTFLDGGSVRKNKIMFIITSNSSNAINEFLKNRPSRLKYFKEYDKLHDKIIKEVVNDLLVNQDHRKDLLDNLPSDGLNMDVLIQIIKEINTHDKPYTKFKDFFNYSVKEYEMYDLAVIIDNVPVVFKQYAQYNIYEGDYIGRHPIDSKIKLYGGSDTYLNNPSGDNLVYYETTDAQGNTVRTDLDLVVKKSEFKNLAKVF